ncbi:hypothetical protein BKA69DRAFT_770779 [Paraphysoderma sedebokerense]|nr:hypothetical protein BKA69DRAFT_770779 [Paraphysoderma sedebokerense]
MFSLKAKSQNRIYELETANQEINAKIEALLACEKKSAREADKLRSTNLNLLDQIELMKASETKIISQLNHQKSRLEQESLSNRRTISSLTREKNDLIKQLDEAKLEIQRFIRRPRPIKARSLSASPRKIRNFSRSPGKHNSPPRKASSAESSVQNSPVSPEKTHESLMMETLSAKVKSLENYINQLKDKIDGLESEIKVSAQQKNELQSLLEQSRETIETMRQAADVGKELGNPDITGILQRIEDSLVEGTVSMPTKDSCRAELLPTVEKLSNASKFKKTSKINQTVNSRLELLEMIQNCRELLNFLQSSPQHTKGELDNILSEAVQKIDHRLLSFKRAEKIDLPSLPSFTLESILSNFSTLEPSYALAADSENLSDASFDSIEVNAENSETRLQQIESRSAESPSPSESSSVLQGPFEDESVGFRSLAAELSGLAMAHNDSHTDDEEIAGRESRNVFRTDGSDQDERNRMSAQKESSSSDLQPASIFAKLVKEQEEDQDIDDNRNDDEFPYCPLEDPPSDETGSEISNTTSNPEKPENFHVPSNNASAENSFLASQPSNSDISISAILPPDNNSQSYVLNTEVSLEKFEPNAQARLVTFEAHPYNDTEDSHRMVPPSRETFEQALLRQSESDHSVSSARNSFVDLNDHNDKDIEDTFGQSVVIEDTVQTVFSHSDPAIELEVNEKPLELEELVIPNEPTTVDPARLSLQRIDNVRFPQKKAPHTNENFKNATPYTVDKSVNKRSDDSNSALPINLRENMTKSNNDGFSTPSKMSTLSRFFSSSKRVLSRASTPSFANIRSKVEDSTVSPSKTPKPPSQRESSELAVTTPATPTNPFMRSHFELSGSVNMTPTLKLYTDPTPDSELLYLTQTMIGGWFYKFNRNGKNPHLRFFWVHPYSLTLCWSKKEPSVDLEKQRKGMTGMFTKSVLIRSVKELEFTLRQSSAQAQADPDKTPRPKSDQRQHQHEDRVVSSTVSEESFEDEESQLLSPSKSAGPNTKREQGNERISNGNNFLNSGEGNTEKTEKVLVIVTPSREVKIKEVNEGDHEIWLKGIQCLLSRSNLNYTPPARTQTDDVMNATMLANASITLGRSAYGRSSVSSAKRKSLWGWSSTTAMDKI